MTSQTQSTTAQGLLQDEHLDFPQRGSIDSPSASQHTASRTTQQLRSASYSLREKGGQATELCLSQSQAGTSQKRGGGHIDEGNRGSKRQRREIIDMTNDDDSITIKVEPVDLSLDDEEEAHDAVYWREEAEAYEEECVEKTFQLLMLRRHNAELLKDNARLRAELENLRRGGDRSLGS